jgi:predicted nuclease of predicted toxin-antitoxin system
MKLLLDECVDQRLRADLHQHEVQTVAEMGWSNFKDGELLSAAQHQFDILITVDRNLPHQQHLPKFRIAVIILRARTNRLADLRPLAPLLLAVLPTAPVGEATIISL